MDDAEFALGELLLNSGDALFCYTDGLLDLRNETGELFGSQRLRDLVSTKSQDGLVNTLVASFESFSKGAVQYDDITLLSLLRK